MSTPGTGLDERIAAAEAASDWRAVDSLNAQKLQTLVSTETDRNAAALTPGLRDLFMPTPASGAEAARIESPDPT